MRDSEDLWLAVKGLLNSSTFHGSANSFDRRPMIALANALGGPRMKLIHWKALSTRAQLPRYGDIDVLDGIEGIDRFRVDIVELFMISHRWLQPSEDRLKAHPDSSDHKKIRAINEFSKWRRQWVRSKHGFWPEIYYWIDFSCIDQSDTSAAIPMLPLWIACCERFLRIETSDYDERAWCRLEPLLSFVYSFTDHHISIGNDYRCNWPSLGTEISLPILNPLSGRATNQSDLDLIRPLVEHAYKTPPANSTKLALILEKSTSKCFRL